MIVLNQSYYDREALDILILGCTHTYDTCSRNHFTSPTEVMKMTASLEKCYTRHDLEVFDLLQHPVFVFDVEKCAMFWSNKAGLQHWNAESLDELLARNFAEDLSEATSRRLQDLLIRLRRGEIIKEQWTMYPAGKPATIKTIASPIRIDGGRCAGLVEGELPGSHEIDHSSTRGIEMLRHLPLAVCQFDINGNLVYQNPEAANEFGTPELGETGTFLTRFVDKGTGKLVLEKVQSGSDYNIEAEQYTQKSSKWFNVSVRRGRDPVSADNIILYSARDISEVKQARKEAVDANLKSEFMAVMAHEIRTPLHQIVGYTDLLGLTDLSPEQLEQVSMISNSTGLLMAIINDLLDYSKLENGKLQVENICFATISVLKSCVAAVENDVLAKGLTLCSELSDDIPSELIGDPNRLRQILLNLFQNAIKFTAIGSITLTVKRIRDESNTVYLSFEVEDTGFGIAQSRKEAIFEKYQQADSSIARNYGGTGLGLAICKSLSEIMGGSISVKSALGVGTTFTVELPFEKPLQSLKKRDLKESSLQEIAEKRLRLSCRDKMAKPVYKILVAEDNKVSQKMMKSMLQRMGHEVKIVENGQGVLDELKTSDFDLILMDIQMPVMDGVTATRHIRRLRGKKALLPVIGLTASYLHSDLEYYKGIGMNSCMGKPVRIENLKKEIENFIVLSQSLESIATVETV
jgi:signal transduction histidine kinase/CheY-like chemotaxis protein